MDRGSLLGGRGKDMMFTALDREIPLETGMAEEPGPVPGIPCPGCRAELLVSTFQESFVLICRCGRRLSPDELLGDPPPELSLGLVALLLLWEDRLGSLQSLAEHARSNGFPNISAVIDKHIGNLRGRVEQLQTLVKSASLASP
jgi:hypothetical protein